MFTQLHMTYSVFIRAVNFHFFLFSIAIAVISSLMTHYIICDLVEMRHSLKMSDQ